MRANSARVYATLLAVSIWGVGCSKAQFSEASGSSSAGSDSASCTASQLSTTSVPVKMLFVVDTSGSNTDNGLYDSYSTDPNKTLRGGSIQQFFDDYAANAYFSWSFVTFSNNSVSSYTSSQFVNAAGMQTAINDFNLETDAGNTPYAQALGAVANMISGDTTATSPTKYIVVFLSDGIPDPAISDGTLSNDITAILGLKSGQISFNTIYYGPEDPDASARLQMMATAGGGHFLDVNSSASGKDFSIVNEITVPGSSCN